MQRLAGGCGIEGYRLHKGASRKACAFPGQTKMIDVCHRLVLIQWLYSSVPTSSTMWPTCSSGPLSLLQPCSRTSVFRPFQTSQRRNRAQFCKASSRTAPVVISNTEPAFEHLNRRQLLQIAGTSALLLQYAPETKVRLVASLQCNCTVHYMYNRPIQLSCHMSFCSVCHSQLLV